MKTFPWYLSSINKGSVVEVLDNWWHQSSTAVNINKFSCCNKIQFKHLQGPSDSDLNSRAVFFFRCGPHSRLLRASAWETEADLEMKVGRFRLKLVHNVVTWTHVICQSFSFDELFLAEFWISAPQGSPEADFRCNFGPFSISLLAT